MARIAAIIRRTAAALALAALVALAPPAAAAGLIRDTEIESAIRSLATPLLQTAGINPHTVRIYIINDDALNAFVAGGSNIFLNTGLLLRTETPDQLAGVLAHEIGHIAGGHLARTADAVRNVSTVALLSMLAGAAAAIATGSGDAAAAVLSGGTSLAGRAIMRHSRTQESAADQAALTYLERTGRSARGLLAFLEVLEGAQLLSRARQSAYAGTHPLTRERIAAVRRHVETSRFSDRPADAAATRRHARMRAKLHGFLKPPARTYRAYPDSDGSFPARYARAIAAHREPAADRAIALIDGLIAEAPDDPFLHELRGQVLFEAGRAPAALGAYRRAAALLPDAPLIAVDLGRVLLALSRPEANEEALGRLRGAVRRQPEMSFAWRQLAIAEGRNGNRGLAALALAEEAMLLNRIGDAGLQARRARNGLAENSPGWLRASDIEQLAERRAGR